MITIYATTTCPYCKMLEEYLKQKEISYSVKLVDQDEAAKEEMMKASGGFLGVPFTVIKNEDNSEQTVIGFDKAKINQILNIL